MPFSAPGCRQEEGGKDYPDAPVMAQEIRRGRRYWLADERYQTQFRFNRKFDKLTVTVDCPELSQEDIDKLKMAMHQNPASE